MVRLTLPDCSITFRSRAMQPGLTLVRRCLTTLVLLGVALSSSGCVPGVGWLPDSTGFIYTSGADYTQLCHFDLQKNERHVLVGDTGAPTGWPAVRSDGQLIAVAKFTAEPMQKQARIQITVYDRQGKEVHRSKVLDWAVLENTFSKEPAKDDPVTLPQLFWAPQGDRILIHVAGHSGIYDAKAAKLVWSAPGALLNFRGGPVRPDGAGFLVMKNYTGWATVFTKDKQAKDIDPHFVFVDWAGKEQPIKAPALMLDVAALQKETNSNKLMALFVPLLFESGWVGDVAQVSYHVDRLRYVTKKGEALLDSVQPEMVEGGMVQSQYRFPGGHAQLRVIALFKKENGPESSNRVRLEVLKAGKKDPEVIVAEAEYCVPVVAPNGKTVAVRSLIPSKDANTREQYNLLVVDDKGTVVANLFTQ
jgi:hypothetical protein